MKDQYIVSQKKRTGHLISDVEESDQIIRQYQKHKRWLLKATYHYSSLNYSKLVSKEILRHDRDKSIDEKAFLKNKTLTKKTLSQIIKINLKNPIESYLVLNKPLTAEDLILDINMVGETFFKGSLVDFSGIKCAFKRFLYSLRQERVILNQLAVLKMQNPRKYMDMLRTGILNYVIESRLTDKKNDIENCFIAGILHDIGFLYLDPKYHDMAPGRFSINDLKNIQIHTQLGFHLLKPWFHEDILNAAMNHHIGEDNSGYPRRVVIKPNRISKLTGFASSFVSCLRKYKLKNALKIQDVYSREKSYLGESLSPLFKRDFYEILETLKIQFNKKGRNIDVQFNRRYSVILHNFLVYIFDLGQELKKIDTLLLNYIRDKASHRLELQNDIDDVFDHIKKLNIIIKSCGKSPGIRRIMKDNLLASSILGDIEIISMELHRNNRFLIGLLNYLNTKIKDFTFETAVLKKALEFSGNIKRNVSSQLEKEINIFNLLNAISSG
ncbi:MAG: hypothetical protein GXP56_10335 [Deltaproteobacteria bacterium]|nr:hypothetical protein [Deltaproteobacteria bacterium]